MTVRSVVVAALVATAVAACSSGSGNGGGAATSGTYACDDAAFEAQRGGPGGGVDREVDVCGTVAHVRRARTTRSGRHGYFDVTLASGDRIEVVANLDAMAGAMNDAPPAWPWVSAGQYVYVRGRYYHDESGREGIDWTEADTSRRWPYPGYVVVCAAPHDRCSEFR